MFKKVQKIFLLLIFLILFPFYNNFLIFYFQVFFLATIAMAAAKPSIGAVYAASAPLIAAPAPIVTASSSQYVARNFNGLYPAAAPLVAAPYYAPAPYVATAASYVAAPAPYVASPYAAARLIAPAAAPLVAAPAPVIPAYARYASPYFASSPYLAAPAPIVALK